MNLPAVEPVNILLVDDRPENLQALEAILSGPAYRLFIAHSGHEALGLLLRHEFALILLDVFMAEMDGFEVAAMIKSRAKTRPIPIIFLTAMNRNLETLQRAYEIGVVDVIQKPLEAEAVRAKAAIFAELFLSRRILACRRQREVKAPHPNQPALDASERLIVEESVSRLRQLRGSLQLDPGATQSLRARELAGKLDQEFESVIEKLARLIRAAGS